MSSKIRIKSAQTTTAPGGILDRGELAFTYANNKLWVGNVNGATNAEIQIGGEITASQADITTSSVKIPTGKAVYDYVAGQLSSAGTFTITDGTTSQTISSGNTLTVTAGTGITAAVSATDTLTVSAKTATSSQLGVASFNTASFTVTSGDVTIKSAGVSNTQLANSSVTIGSTSVSLGGTAATVAGLTLTNPTLNVGSGTLVVPYTATPAQTAEGSLVWNSTSDLLTVGTGTARKTMVDTDTSGQTISNKTIDSSNTINKSPVITLGGDLTGSVTLTDLGSATLSATIAANSVALGTDTTGNYIATIAGTTNQVSVSGSGSETAAVTLSLPQDIHSGANPSFAGATLDAVTVGVATASTITTTAGNLVLDSFTGTTNVNDNLIVAGNLTVQGTTTTVDSTVVTIVDPIFTLGSDTVVDTYDRGIAYKYKSGVTNYEGFFGWDRSDNAFVFKVPNAENDESDGTIAGTTYGSAIFSNITGATIYADQIIGNFGGQVRIDDITIQTGGFETTLNSEQLIYNNADFTIASSNANSLYLGSIDYNTYFDSSGNLSVGNSSASAGISVYGNITSTNTGVSSIDGFVIDGGTF